MLLSIDINSNVAVYVQIENQVQFAIASGKLKAGDQLPSVRELSERLSVNPNTVAKAYRDLEVMGFLYTRRGMGVFVNKGIETKCREECRKRTIERMHEIVAEAKAAGMQCDELLNIVATSYEQEGEPYADAPPEVVALAKLRSRAE
jgi:GntR family transcriptional regulator